MKTILKKMLTLIFVTSLLSTNIGLMANPGLMTSPWKRFAPEAAAMLKKFATASLRGLKEKSVQQWNRFTPQAEGLFKKTIDLAKSKGALGLTLATPFGSPFICGGYCGKKQASLNTLNKPEKTTLSILGLRLGGQASITNFAIAKSTYSMPFKVALSGISLAVPIASFALGYRLGELATKRRNNEIIPNATVTNKIVTNTALVQKI